MKKKPEARTPVGAWRGHAVRLMALWAVLGAAYSNSFDAPPVFDGAKILSQDVRIRAATAQNARLIAGEEYWYGSAPSGLYRPLTTFTYLFNYAVLGERENPAGYHWANFLLHGINATLVYGLGLVWFGDAWMALALAGLWGVHPLLTDSVTNIVGRADLLAAFGVFAGLWFYAKKPRGWIAGLAAAQAIGIFAKENAAVLPLLMLLWDWTRNEAGDWRRKSTAYSAAAVAIAIFLVARSGVHTKMLIPIAENPLVGAGFGMARLTAAAVIGKLAWLFVWPARLSADYSYNAVRVGLDIGGLLTVAGLAAAAILWRRGRFFVLFWFVALLPTANLVILIGSIMAERFAYLASVGLAGCAVAAAFALLRQRRATAAVVLVACVALAARTYARNIDWGDERGFWAATVAAVPGAARPHNNLGNALSKIPGQSAAAIAEFHEALRIRPDYADAHYNLANALVRSPGGLESGIAEYREALRIEPGFAQAHLNLGTALAQVPGRLPDAMGEFEAAVRSDPKMSDARYNLGTVLAQMGRTEEATVQFEALVRMDPGHAKARNNLGILLMGTPGRLADAIAQFQEALRIEPGYAKARENLNAAMERQQAGGR